MVNEHRIKTVENLLQVMEQAELLSGRQLEALRKRFPRSGPAEQAALWAVKKQLVTRWQARVLLAGGRRLRFGNYLLCDELTVDGWGRVYRARHQQMDHQVALRVLPKDLGRTPETILNHLRRLASLNHPHWLSIVDVDCDGQRFFVVYDQVEGESLQWRKETQGALSVRSAARVLAQTAAALAYLHGQQLVHGMLTPGHVLIDGHDRVKVLGGGFPLSRGHVGLPFQADDRWQAPEVSETGWPSPSSDVFSLGKLGWWALGLEGTEKGQENQETLALAPAESADLVRLVKQMTASRPEARPAADSAHQALGHWLAQTSPAAGTRTGVPFLSSRFWNQPAVKITLLVVGGLGLMGLGAGAAVLLQPRSAPPAVARQEPAQPQRRIIRRVQEPVAQPEQQPQPAPTPLAAAGEETREQPVGADPAEEADGRAGEAPGQTPQGSPASGDLPPKQPEEPASPPPAAPKPRATPPRRAPADNKKQPKPAPPPPLQSFPAAVSLPAFPDGTPGPWATLGRLVLRPGDLCQLRLEGSRTALRGRGGFTIVNAAGGTAENQWEVWRSDDMNVRLGHEPIALLRLEQDQLQFRWTGTKEGGSEAEQLINCLLHIDVGVDARLVALRTPVKIPQIQASLVEPSTIRCPIPAPPPPQNVRFAVTGITHGPAKYQLQPAEPVPVDPGEVWVVFGDKPQDQVVLLRVQCRLRRNLEITVQPYFRVPGEEKPVLLTRERLRQALRAAQTAQRQKQLELNQLKAAEKSLKGEAPAIRQQKSLVAQRANLTSQAIEQLGHMIDQLQRVASLVEAENSPLLLDVQLVFATEGGEIVLLRTDRTIQE